MQKKYFIIFIYNRVALIRIRIELLRQEKLQVLTFDLISYVLVPHWVNLRIAFSNTVVQIISFLEILDYSNTWSLPENKWPLAPALNMELTFTVDAHWK